VAELVPLLSEGLVLVRDEYQGARAGATGQKVEGQRTVIHGGGMHNHDRCLESTETRENVEIFQKFTWLTLDSPRNSTKSNFQLASDHQSVSCSIICLSPHSLGRPLTVPILTGTWGGPSRWQMRGAITDKIRSAGRATGASFFLSLLLSLIPSCSPLSLANMSWSKTLSPTV
jgi:hypothetical protein